MLGWGATRKKIQGCFLIVVSLLVVDASLGQSVLRRVAESPIPSNARVTLSVPEGLLQSGSKLRLRNLANGRSAVVDTANFSQKQELPQAIFDSLTASGSAQWVPALSALSYKQETVRRPGPSDPLRHSGQRVDKSLVFDQPTWQDIGFVSSRSGNNVHLTLDFGVQNVLLTPEQAQQRNQMVERAGVKKLFEIGWKGIEVGRYDFALEAFEKVFLREAQLGAAEKNNGYLGRAISGFHQNGCDSALPDFARADADPKNSDDVSYFRSLCMVEKKKHKDAEAGFKTLVQKQHPSYAEPSRFYLGVVAENDERWDEAETAYLDTIDFANDPKLVALAKERLAQLKAKRADTNYENRWWVAALTTQVGYDSNVTSIPAEINPADRGLEKKSDFGIMGLGFLQATLPWSKRFEHRVRYSLLAMHYLDESISESADITMNDLGTEVSWEQGQTRLWTTELGYNLVNLGPLGSSSPYASTPYLGVRRKTLFLDSKSKEVISDSEHGFKYSRVSPRQAAASEQTDATANVYLYSYRFVSYQKKPHILGPGLDLEWRQAVGSSVTNLAMTVLGRWDLPVGPQNWQLYAAQEGALATTMYYLSESDRKDLLLRYTGSIGRQWTSWLETKIQFVGTLNFSTDSENSSYKKAQLNFQANAFF